MIDPARHMEFGAGDRLLPFLPPMTKTVHMPILFMLASFKYLQLLHVGGCDEAVTRGRAGTSRRYVPAGSTRDAGGLSQQRRKLPSRRRDGCLFPG